MNPLKRNTKLTLTSIVLGLSLVGCSPNMKNRGVADEGAAARSAFEIYSELQQSATDFSAKALMVNGDLAIDGMGAGVTYGAEKEASSALLTRIMTPDSSQFKRFVTNLPDAERKEFLSDFLDNYVKNANGYRTYMKDGVKIDLAADVVDLEGNAKTIDIEQLKNVDYKTADLEVLTQKFNLFVEMTDDRPLTFVKPSVRMKMFNGTLPGLTSSRNLNPIKGGGPGYDDWKAIFGPAEKYLMLAEEHHGNGGGWEINFNAMKSYGEFEEMVVWFRSELENAGKLFQAPGHQRLVFRRHPNLKEEKLSEVYKAIQALIVVDGIKGKTGIEKASYKSVQTDAKLTSLDTYRGVIRLEKSRWGSDNYGVEFRAGTKDIKATRFYQTVLASRVATNDWDGIADVGDWTLYDGASPDAGDLARRFDVTEEVAQKAINNLQSANVKESFMVPFWGWTDDGNPFLGKPKRSLVKNLTKDFIEQAAELASDAGEEPARELMRGWTKATNMSLELRNYLQPKRGFEMTKDLLNFEAPSGRRLIANAVNVNEIDLGIEYSGKLPLKLQADYTDDKLMDNKKAWLQTRVDLSNSERDNLLKKVASDLIEELGATGEPVKVEDPGGHGHGLELSWEIKDTQNRKWIVEWDGIGRSYSPAGDVIADSPRAGSMELVTPKFTPNEVEMKAVYNAMEKNNILPSLLTGGGHINVDLAAFDGKPKQLARFMTLFHENRGTISLMFQHYNRLKSGEPIDISDGLSQKLKNFGGTEDELKKLLYNEQYFNTRYARKTRYNQLEMSAFFQDVIPDDLLTDDFDINSPTDPWRRTFRVDPKIRKAEFRLFNAPRDPAESALQIRLVRALLSKALNEDDELSGVVQKVDHVDYLKNPDKAYADLEKMCDQLGLNVDDYRPAMAEGLSETDLAKRSIFFETLDEKLALHPKQGAWGDAVTPRAESASINSTGRQWTPGAADQTNTMTHESRVQSAVEAEARRANIVPERQIPGRLRRSDSCIDAMAPFI